jgi:hypothetical protein
MIPLADFRAAFRHFNQRAAVLALFVVLTPLAGLAVMKMYGPLLRAWLSASLSSAGVEFTVAAVPAAVSAVVVLPLLAWTFVLRRDQRLQCPACGRWLFAIGYVTIATRHCGRCGERILGDAESLAKPPEARAS